MPAEWERHEAVWLAWPHDPTTFPEGRLARVEETFARNILALHKTERVNLLVRDAKMGSRVIGTLESAGVDMSQVTLTFADYADVWIRDYGPIFLVDGSRSRLAMTKWVFNSWGNKYTELLSDNEVFNRLRDEKGLRLFDGVRCFEPGMVLEGGSVDTNGQGTLLTTEQCLLNKNRNPDMKRGEIARRLRDFLGVEKIIWLREGVEGDDTDGHVDDIARFAAPDAVLCCFDEDKNDSNHGPLKRNFELLSSSTLADGAKIRVKKLPMPGWVGGSGDRLPASYANFYIGNRVVLVPTFGHEHDKRALDIIGDAIPGHKVIGVDCRDMVYGFGTIHCASQQQPAVEER